MDSSWKEDEDEDLRNLFVPEAFCFVSGSCGGRAFAFSFIVFRTKLYNPPMYSAIIFIGGCALFLFLPSQSCFVSGQKLRCNVTLHCARGVLWHQDFATRRRRSSPSQVGLSSPRWARPCRGSQPQITALRSTSTSKTPFIAIHFEPFSSIFVSCNSLKRNEFN